jgi:serine/threonine protein kinase
MGSNNHTILSKIAHGKYTFNAVEWKHASHDCKHLIHHMLTYNPDYRFSAAQCLSHPWIRQQESVNGNGRYISVDCFNNLRVFCVSGCIIA